MDELTAPQQNRLLAGLSNLLRRVEQDSGPEFLPRGLDVMGLVRQLALPSAETVEKMSYGDPLFRMPTQSNIPITTDRGYLAEVLGMLPAVPAASRATTRLSNEAADALVRQITGNQQATAQGALQAAGEMAPLARIFAPQQAKSVMPETKALDESGNPVMVYHGTTQAKDLEKAGKFGSWRSAWFTDSPVVAKTYAAGRQEFGSHRGRAIYPSYLDMKNPFVVDARGNSWRSVPAVLPNEGGDELYYTTDKLAKFARQNGYDGLIVKNVFDPGSGRMPTTDAGDVKLTGTTYVVFDPEKQVKSAVSDPAFTGLLEPQAVAPRASEQSQQVTAATQSDNFKNWFGDWQSDPQNASKIVDEQGLPMPVYHGSGSADIKEFDLANFEKVQKGDWGRGIYFSPSKWMADGYRKTAIKASDKTVQEAFDNEEKLARSFGTKPMNKWLDLQSGKISQEQYDKLTEAEQVWRDAIKKVDESSEGKVYDAYLNIKNPYNYTYSGITEPDLALQAKRAGHDGLIIRSESGEIEEIVVFDPKQIKSASENTGEFSSETANIFRGAVPTAGAGLLGAGMYQDEQMF